MANLNCTILLIVLNLLSFLVLSQCSYYSINAHSVMQYDMKTAVFTKEAPFHMDVPSQYKTKILRSQVVDQDNQTIYGSFGNYGTWVDFNVYTVLYSYRVNEKKVMQSSQILSYSVDCLLFDQTSHRLYGLVSGSGVSVTLLEYDTDTLQQKYIVANFTKEASGRVRSGYYLPHDRTFTYYTDSSRLVTLNLAKIPAVIERPNQVDIVEKIVNIDVPFFTFGVDPSVTLNGIPLVFSTFKHDVYVFRHDNGQIVQKVQVVPDSFTNIDDSNDFVIDPVTHNLYLDVAILHTGENFFFSMNTKTLELNGQSVSKDPNFIYPLTPLKYVRD